MYHDSFVDLVAIVLKILEKIKIFILLGSVYIYIMKTFTRQKQFSQLLPCD